MAVQMTLAARRRRQEQLEANRGGHAPSQGGLGTQDQRGPAVSPVLTADERKARCAQVVSITGAEVAAATTLLEALKWNVEAVVNTILDGDTPDQAGPPSPPPEHPTPPQRQVSSTSAGTDAPPGERIVCLRPPAPAPKPTLPAGPAVSSSPSAALLARKRRTSSVSSEAEAAPAPGQAAPAPEPEQAAAAVPVGDLLEPTPREKAPVLNATVQCPLCTMPTPASEPNCNLCGEALRPGATKPPALPSALAAAPSPVAPAAVGIQSQMPLANGFGPAGMGGMGGMG
eukprot:CAMPEP_0114555072 /NCGR_PEP_ID=MMETSP0114-20121206/8552_1 /TAXON_ID=31324 /ORGANISM="Goniomonas sp, Strain m" /LENGTH=285 /DNA_ID=CAMNT_0001740169 /DNA_START=13 /DNA_END=866 /DNA_ORIENTATION=-